jgi:hypothetical protein
MSRPERRALFGALEVAGREVLNDPQHAIRECLRSRRIAPGDVLDRGAEVARGQVEEANPQRLDATLSS